MDDGAEQRKWFWATLMLSSMTVVAVVFAVSELVENRFFRTTDYVTLHYLYITRGILSSLLLAVWAAWYVLRQRRRTEQELRRSRERYRGLLEASPGAVALYDVSLQVAEWNATAERLYGFCKAEVLGQPLPTVPPEKEAELRQLLAQVETGRPVLDIETLRRDKSGVVFEVQLSLLPFREASGRSYFLEVAADIRERVRLRQKLLEIEKLASMGQMAAGTAHHLNTPLAAMLLRVQMMRERSLLGAYSADLERLESGMRFCQHFVQRLLEFSRRAPVEKQPQEVAATIESVVSFFAPPLLTKGARMSVDLSAANGERVLADRNLLEALFSILLSNALDAIDREGSIGIHCRRVSGERLEIQITDDGCGIAASDLPHIFEPFFTTKGPGKGTGLGLAIARNIVLEHGGSIRLERAPRQGTIALVELPLYRSAAAGAEVPA
ncbi:MAG: PAS domain S-box protein [Acidobacteria bacterium]|nr:PAS domain S-box protein [Acidobacteriota bacterium]